VRSTIFDDGRVGPVAREAAAPEVRRARLGRMSRLPTTTSVIGRPDRDAQDSSASVLYGDLFKEHDLPPPMASCCTALPLRQDADRRGRRQLARQTRREKTGQHPPALRTFLTSRVRSCSTITSVRPIADPPFSSICAGEERRGYTPSCLLRRDGFRCSAPAHRHLRDIESTIVPQLLAEIDASNSEERIFRASPEDLIDPLSAPGAGST